LSARTGIDHSEEKGLRRRFDDDVCRVVIFYHSAGALACGPHRPAPYLEKTIPPGEAPMTQTTSRFFDEVARLMNDAAGVAQGVRREVDTLFRTQAERWLRDLDLVKREEFEAVKDMARLAREENEALKTRLSAVEASAGSHASGEHEALKARITALEAQVQTLAATRPSGETPSTM
jgi:BMFP domain-containing protein YqiC